MSTDQASDATSSVAGAKQVSAASATASLKSPNDPRIVSLLGAASAGTLIIYGGAGVSFSSNMPSGRQLAQNLHDRIVGDGVALVGADRDDLLSVADTAAGLPGGLDMLQQAALRSFDFANAESADSHQALALLMLEGAVRVLSTNWDTCIERSAPSGERISVVVTDADRTGIESPSLLKVHGCADQPTSLLITSEQLDQPPLWSDTAIASALSQSTVVFLGIGDVAPYVRRRLTEVVAALGPGSQVAVVTPSIRTKWDTSQWSAVLPTLPIEKRWEFTADNFCQLLLSAWVNSALTDYQEFANSIGSSTLPSQLRELIRIVKELPAAHVLKWLRRSASPLKTGRSIVKSPASKAAFLVMAKLTEHDQIQEIPAHGPLKTTNSRLDLMIETSARAGIEVSRLATRRAEQYRIDGSLGPRETLDIICAGHLGPLTLHRNLPTNLVSAPAVGDIMEGSLINLIDAQNELADLGAA